MIALTDIRKGFAWFILAVVFDACHYHLWQFFNPEAQVYVYDSLELIKVFLYVYAGVQVFEKIGKTAKVLCNTFLFYCSLDVINFVYDFDGVLSSLGSNMELYTFIFSIFYLLYVQKERLALVFYETFGNNIERR